MCMNIEKCMNASHFLNLAVIFPLDFESQSTPAQAQEPRKGSQARPDVPEEEILKAVSSSKLESQLCRPGWMALAPNTRSFRLGLPGWPRWVDFDSYQTSKFA